MTRHQAFNVYSGHDATIMYDDVLRHTQTSPASRVVYLIPAFSQTPVHVPNDHIKGTFFTPNDPCELDDTLFHIVDVQKQGSFTVNPMAGPFCMKGVVVVIHAHQTLLRASLAFQSLQGRLKELNVTIYLHEASDWVGPPPPPQANGQPIFHTVPAPATITPNADNCQQQHLKHRRLPTDYIGHPQYDLVSPGRRNTL